jgi:acyl dehydratase
LIALRRIRDLVFKRPLRAGDTIQVRAAEADWRAVDEETGLAWWHWRVVNQDGELVCRVTIEALCRFASALA